MPDTPEVVDKSAVWHFLCEAGFRPTSSNDIGSTWHLDRSSPLYSSAFEGGIFLPHAYSLNISSRRTTCSDMEGPLGTEYQLARIDDYF